MAFFARPTELSLMLVVTTVAAVAGCRSSRLLDVLCAVAGMTLQASMGASQGIRRLLVVIKAPTGPAVWRVTCRTGGSDTSLMVVVRVATRACLGHILERWRSMTLFAGHDRMQPDQRKARDIVVEGDFLAPTRFVVTLLAFASKLACMRIVLLVARGTHHAELVAVETAGMARLALDLRVAATQGKARCLGVIESNRFPGLHAVARLAFGAMATSMRILNLVAGHARRREPLVALAGMACCASNLGVGALQGKFGPRVIERLHPPPGLFAVAGFAAFTQPPLVGIDRLMAIETSAGRGPKLDARRMTAFTAGGFVGSLELKICEGVIEHLTIELDDISRPALVIGMTCLAVSPGDIRPAAMQSLLRVDVIGDRLMAIQAQPRLRALGESLMTIGAVAFQLGMTFNERPGHDEALENGLSLRSH
jgi:hypothetical protein